MTCMFLGASTFNQPIAHWDTSKVTRMEYMFSQAGSFNQPIGIWDTSKVTRMHYMFNAASVFNQPIANWNVSSVTNMGSMFNDASSFNEPISDWNTSSVTDLNRMFTNATSFNQDLSSWEISKSRICRSLLRRPRPLQWQQGLDPFLLLFQFQLEHRLVGSRSRSGFAHQRQFPNRGRPLVFRQGRRLRHLRPHQGLERHGGDQYVPSLQGQDRLRREYNRVGCQQRDEHGLYVPRGVGF